MEQMVFTLDHPCSIIVVLSALSHQQKVSETSSIIPSLEIGDETRNAFLKIASALNQVAPIPEPPQQSLPLMSPTSNTSTQNNNATVQRVQVEIAPSLATASVTPLQNNASVTRVQVTKSPSPSTSTVSTSKAIKSWSTIATKANTTQKALDAVNQVKTRYDIHPRRQYNRRLISRYNKRYSRAATRLLAQHLTNTKVLPNFSTPVVNHI